MPGIFYPQCRATLSVVFDGFGGGDSKPFIADVRPKSAQVHLNGYHDADTFGLDFDLATLPFSPDLLRSVAVQLYLFDAGGVTTPADWNTEDNRVIVGLVDLPRSHRGSDGKTIHFEGRDYTGLLLDRQWDPAKRVPVGQPLNEVVQQLVDEGLRHTDGSLQRTLTVRPTPAEVREASLDVPVLTGVSALDVHGKIRVDKKGKLHIPKAGAGKGRANRHGVPAKNGNSYWDVIYRLCISHGFIVFVRGLDVVISQPHILDDEAASRAVTLAWGRNLEYFDEERKLGKEAVPTIVVVCNDGGKTLRAQWPPSAHTKTTAIATKKDEYQIVTETGISDVGELRNIARMRYQNLARSESKVKFATRDLRDESGRSLLRLRSGDPVAVKLDELGGAEMAQLTAAQRRSRLVRLGYHEEIAQFVADQYDQIKQYQRPYYARDISFDWGDGDDGLKIEVEGVNYVSEARDDAR